MDTAKTIFKTNAQNQTTTTVSSILPWFIGAAVVIVALIFLVKKK